VTALAGHPETHPLKWAVPDGYESLPAPRLLKRLTRLATRSQQPSKKIGRMLRDWLADSERSNSDPIWALEAIAWCHLLPRLADMGDGVARDRQQSRRTGLPRALWTELYERLREVAARSVAIALHDDPVRHQLLAAELPLTLAFAVPGLPSSQDLVVPAQRALSFGLVELLDGDGLPCAAHLPHFRELLACWTRCWLLSAAAGWRAFDRAARVQYKCMVRQALRLSRPDGTLVLSHGASGDWCHDLLQAALRASGGRTDRKLSRLVLPGRRSKKGLRQKARHLPPSSTYSEWGEVCAMRSTWSHQSPQFVCLFGQRRLQSESIGAGRTLWSGDVAPSITVDGQLLHPESDWTELCWFTDKDVDYLELEVDCQDGWQIQRLMLLARRDGFLFLADALEGPRAASIRYDLRLPLADEVRCEWEGETREALLCNDRVLSAVVPLALPEWRSARAVGELHTAEHALWSTMTCAAQRLYAPLLFDLVPRRAAGQRTWRQLTVAEDLQQVSPEVAVGYRVQFGYHQWLFYRSLAPRGNRTVLGQNLADEFVAARFDADGSLSPLIEVE